MLARANSYLAYGQLPRQKSQAADGLELLAHGIDGTKLLDEAKLRWLEAF